MRKYLRGNTYPSNQREIEYVFFLVITNLRKLKPIQNQFITWGKSLPWTLSEKFENHCVTYEKSLSFVFSTFQKWKLYPLLSPHLAQSTFPETEIIHKNIHGFSNNDNIILRPHTTYNIIMSCFSFFSFLFIRNLNMRGE